MCFFLTTATHLILPLGATKANVILPPKKLTNQNKGYAPTSLLLIELLWFSQNFLQLHCTLVTFQNALLRNRHIIPNVALPVQLHHYIHCHAFINADHSYPNNLNNAHACSSKLLLKQHNLPFENTFLAVSLGHNTQFKSIKMT